MAKDILKAIAEQEARDEARQARAKGYGYEIVSRGFRKTYTDEELAEIMSQRAELRKRLFGQ